MGRLAGHPIDQYIASHFSEIAVSAIRRIGLLFRLLIALAGLLAASGPAGRPEVARADSPFDPVPYESLPPDVKIETVVGNANQLVAMAFTPDGRLLYTERTGNVRVVVNDQLLAAPANTFTSVIDTQGERGLLGIAVDPGFATNHYVWAYYTRRIAVNPAQYENRVVRFELGDDNQSLNTEKAYGFPVDPYVTIHNGGNLHFGPDGQLYISVGNNTPDGDPGTPSQIMDSPLGKLHRFAPTLPLSAAPGNPFAGSSFYAMGLRNSFDFDFDPVSGGVFASENGSDCDDELNRLVPGGNYGWRAPYPCDDATGPDPRYNTLPPLKFWTPSLAPTGVAFYTGGAIAEWQNDLFMCSYKDATTAIHHFKLNDARTAIISHTVLLNPTTQQPIKCRTDLLTGPDGALYFSEGGGYPQNNGPIKRLIRRASFVGSTVSPRSPIGQAGGTADVQIDLRHHGAVESAFALTVTVPPSAQVLYAEGWDGELNVTPSNVFWSGSMTGTLTWTVTYRLQLTEAITTPYVLVNDVALTSPGLTSLAFAPVVIVNGWAAYLPIGLRR